MILGVLAAAASAMEVRTGETVVVPAGELVNDDLYVFAESVRIEGTVQGDLVAAGRWVTVQGAVSGDVVAAGERVILHGVVRDDARLAGALVRVAEDAQVYGDLVTAGAVVEALRGSTVGGDLAVGAGQVLLAGQVADSVRAGAGALRIDGEVGGDVRAYVGGPDEEAAGRFWVASEPVAPLPAGLTFGPDARVGGQLDYSAPEPSAQDRTVAAGGVHYTATTPPETGPNPVVAGLRRFLALFAAGAVLLALAPRLVTRAVDVVDHYALRALGIGAGSALGGMIGAATIGLATLFAAVVVGLVTLGGLSFVTLAAGAALELGWVVALLVAAGFLAQAIVAVAVGERVVPNRYGALALGLLILVVLRAIPVLGTVVSLGVALVGLGALVDALFVRRMLPPKRELGLAK